MKQSLGAQRHPLQGVVWVQAEGPATHTRVQYCCLRALQRALELQDVSTC